MDKQQANLLEAVRGQPDLLRGVLKRVSPTNYRHLPMQVAAVIDLLRVHVAATPKLETAFENLNLRARGFVETVDGLGLEAQPGNSAFDGAGAALLAAVDDLEVALEPLALKAA